MKTFIVFLIFLQSIQAALSPAEAINLLRKRGVEATSQTRSSVAASLRSIVIPEMIELEGYSMTEVIAFLDSKIKERHPNINLIINLRLKQNEPNIATNAPPVQIDPVTGLPMQDIAPNIVDIKKILNPEDIKIIGLKNKLRNLNALQLIELITLSFDTPIQYVITNYGVVFLPLPADQVGLVSRTFKIRPNVFNNGTPPTLGRSNTNQNPVNNTPRMSKGILNINR